MKAKMVARFILAYTKHVWPDDYVQMAKTGAPDYVGRYFSPTDAGSHKYIPADRLTADIGAKQGSGVFGYAKFDDGSYLLYTCFHGLAVWDGTDARAEVVAL